MSIFWNFSIGYEGWEKENRNFKTWFKIPRECSKWSVINILSSKQYIWRDKIILWRISKFRWNQSRGTKGKIVILVNLSEISKFGSKYLEMVRNFKCDYILSWKQHIYRDKIIREATKEFEIRPCGLPLSVFFQLKFLQTLDRSILYLNIIRAISTPCDHANSPKKWQCLFQSIIANMKYCLKEMQWTPLCLKTLTEKMLRF